MDSEKKVFSGTFVVGLALIPLTALSIYFTYGAVVFGRWPWLRFSIVMSVMTCLWTYTFSFFHLVENDRTLNPLVFAVFCVPFDMLLLYPGTAVLEIPADADMVRLMFVLEILHGGGFYVLRKGMQSYICERLHSLNR